MPKNKKPLLTIVIGTARKGRQSHHVANYIAQVAKKLPFRIKIADVKDYVKKPKTIPDWEGNKITDPWRRLVKRTDAFVLVIPEYNHFPPGELKLLLDMDFDNYYKKPCLVAGVSAGNLGGARIIEVMHILVNSFKMISVPAPLRFGNVQDFAKMKPNEKQEAYGKRIEKSLSVLQELL